jgi:hypothetical protein
MYVYIYMYINTCTFIYIKGFEAISLRLSKGIESKDIKDILPLTTGIYIYIYIYIYTYTNMFIYLWEYIYLYVKYIHVHT